MQNIKISRKRNVANVLGSLRIEKLAPSSSLLVQIKAYESGELTSTELVRQVTQRYVALRSR
jgi:hypothetical protein